jgi:hypothetical protein
MVPQAIVHAWRMVAAFANSLTSRRQRGSSERMVVGIQAIDADRQVGRGLQCLSADEVQRHCSVEVCSTLDSVKYLYKYLTKGETSRR